MKAETTGGSKGMVLMDGGKRVTHAFAFSLVRQSSAEHELHDTPTYRPKNITSKPENIFLALSGLRKLRYFDSIP